MITLVLPQVFQTPAISQNKKTPDFSSGVFFRLMITLVLPQVFQTPAISQNKKTPDFSSGVFFRLFFYNSIVNF